MCPVIFAAVTLLQHSWKRKITERILCKPLNPVIIVFVHDVPFIETNYLNNIPLRVKNTAIFLTQFCNRFLMPLSDSDTDRPTIKNPDRQQ